MRWLTCIEDEGYPELQYGARYLVEPIAAGAVRVWVEGGGTIICSADRFAGSL